MYDGGAILALDAATRTGVCEGEPGATPVLETVDFAGSAEKAFKRSDCMSASEYRRLSAVTKPSSSDFDIWARAQVWAIRRINGAAEGGRPIKLVAIEGLVPQYDKTIQCGIYAVLGAVARNKGIPIMSVMPQTWRADVLGDGKLKRGPAKTRAVWLCSQLGWNPQNDDEAEAGCIHLWACMQVAPRLMPRLPLFMRGAA